MIYLVAFENLSKVICLPVTGKNSIMAYSTHTKSGTRLFFMLANEFIPRRWLGVFLMEYPYV